MLSWILSLALVNDLLPDCTKPSWTSIDFPSVIPQEHLSIKFFVQNSNNFHARKCISKCFLPICHSIQASNVFPDWSLSVCCSSPPSVTSPMTPRAPSTPRSFGRKRSPMQLDHNDESPGQEHSDRSSSAGKRKKNEHEVCWQPPWHLNLRT